IDRMHPALVDAARFPMRVLAAIEHNLDTAFPGELVREELVELRIRPRHDVQMAVAALLCLGTVMPGPHVDPPQQLLSTGDMRLRGTHVCAEHERLPEIEMRLCDKREHAKLERNGKRTLVGLRLPFDGTDQ